MIEAEDYGTAIPRLLHLASKYPGSTAAQDARFWLGVAYYRIQGYRDAITMFQEYLELAPNGQYATESAEYAAKLTDEYGKRYKSPQALDSSIGELAAKVQANPSDRNLQMQLADLLWQRGDYNHAGEIYAKLVGADPNFTADPVVAARVEFLGNGTYVLLTPTEIQRRQIAEEPLVVEGPASFKSGPDLLTREPRYYVVTGRVRNRSDSVLYGVEVHVTLYGFGNVVFDTNTSNVGRMNPGEVRAFSIQFSNFPNIDDINRYEIVPAFQR
jgi:tetratricopeptide (TPR) repeat protein